MFVFVLNWDFWDLWEYYDWLSCSLQPLLDTTDQTSNRKS